MKFSNNGTFKPRLKTMNLDQMKAIHEAALKILDVTGFEMQHEDVRRMLLDAGCSPLDGGRLSMPEKLVEKALKTAPKQILLHDQTGKPVMDIQGENCFYGTGSDTIFTIDLDTGERRRTMIQDTANFAKMVDALDNMDFAMSMSNPEDVPIGNIYGHVFLEMVKNTNKPLIFIADSGRDMAQIHQIVCLVAGGEEELAKKPFILNYSEAISPLIYPVNVMEKLVFCAEKQIPICLPSGCNAGGGGPITLAGAMALGIAENLVGLVIHQLTRPGSPFLFAPQCEHFGHADLCHFVRLPGMESYPGGFGPNARRVVPHSHLGICRLFGLQGIGRPGRGRGHVFHRHRHALPVQHHP